MGGSVVWQVVWQACLACQAALPRVKVHMPGRLNPQLTIRRLLRRGKLVAQITPLLLQGVRVKAIQPPLPTNHKALLTCRYLCLNLQRIRGVQQQVVRIQNPIRIKDNKHVSQSRCVGCFPLTCQAVRRENSSREDAVNNYPSSSASLAHIQHLRVVTTCNTCEILKFQS